MLTEHADTYLAVRRSVGFKLREDEILLRSYLHFAERSGDDHVRNETVLKWAAASSSPFQRERRLRVIRRFAEHARAEDPTHQVPPEHVFASGYQRRPPYIYSPDEVKRLLAAAKRLQPRGLRPLSYHALFALLACSGLRVSEAIALRIGDVTPDGLVIRETKFRKSRLVPLHPTAEAGLARYLDHRAQAGPKDDHVFLSTKRRGVTYDAVRWAFSTIVKELGLVRSGRRPRIHDFRHTFAVGVFARCPEGRDHAGRYLRALSTYLGHTNIANTYWYLQAAPLLLRDMAKAYEAIFDGGTS